ncbi:MAG TPA: Ig-like domain-containing protein [Candidatus Nitrosotenuis sp.]|nr:Ig-like domain-containing protein [Candidatus Nitrosotenuis sp.]
MRVGIILAVFIAYTITMSLAYAEEFDIRFVPSKLVENSEAKMHVFVTDGTQMIPTKISGLTVTSLDSSVLHIEKVQEGNSFVTEVVVKSGKAGTTTIYLAAPGFTSKEIPVTVYGNKNNAATLLIKVTPDTFTTSGSSEGYIAVQLADEDGFPVTAKEDTVVTLNTASRDIVEFPTQNLIIKKGEYFAYTKFNTKQSGTAVLYATSPGIETQSSTVTVEEDEDLTVKLYTYPKTLTIHDASKGFIIAQLQDSGGRPVLAQKDITVYYKLVDSDDNEATNYSSTYNYKSSGYFSISKGSYWGYTQYSLPQGIEDTYELIISTQDPLVVESEEIIAEDLELMDDKIVKFETLPVLTTGKSELIGVVYLEDENDNPVVAERNIQIKIDSSDSKSLFVPDVTISKGDQIALVYGTVSNSAPSDLELRPVVNNGELTSVDIFGPDKDSLELVAEPLISDVLAGTSFPLILYLKDGTEVTSFPEAQEVFVAPNEYVEVQPKKILPKDNLVILDAKALKKGTTTLSVEVGDFEDTATIENLSSDPANLILDHSQTIFVGNNDVFSIQLVNSAGIPTYATSDVEVSVVVKDQQMLDIPSKVIIPKGSHYILFDVAPKASGKTEISFLSKELPLLKDEITISSLVPEVSITAPDSVNSTEGLIVTASARANGKPLVGLSVQWQVDGGSVDMADSTTGPTGDAAASIMPLSSQVTIKATVSGQLYPDATVTKVIQVISDDGMPVVVEEQAQKQYSFEIFGFDPILIIVPGAIGAAGFMLKKKGRLTIKK